MLRSIFFAALLVAAPVVAQEMDPTMNWRECAYDENCVAIQGTCDMTAVNVGYKDDAVAYYRKLHAKANCVEKFWQPTKNMIPQCKPIAGSKATKDAEVVPHSVCAMVPKPQPKTQTN